MVKHEEWSAQTISKLRRLRRSKMAFRPLAERYLTCGLVQDIRHFSGSPAPAKAGQGSEVPKLYHI